MNIFRMHLSGTWRKREISNNINKTSLVVLIWTFSFKCIEENLVEAGDEKTKA